MPQVEGPASSRSPGFRQALTDVNQPKFPEETMGVRGGWLPEVRGLGA